VILWKSTINIKMLLDSKRGSNQIGDQYRKYKRGAIH